jgi:uncharacterized protein
VIAALPLGVAVGLTLGAVGGGGAILAVPLLVYALGQDAHAATTTSLVVVAAAAIAGGTAQAGRACVCWPQVWTLAPAVLAGSFAGTLANQAAPASVLLVSFVPVLFAAAWTTWRRAQADETAGDGCPPLAARRTLAAGTSVGALTGFLGVGGGFLVVPMLASVLRIPLRRAIGTSLVIVGFATVAALAGHLWRSGDLDTGLTISMAVGCAAGGVAGANLGNFLSERVLGQGFALLALAVGAYVLVQSGPVMVP